MDRLDLPSFVQVVGSLTLACIGGVLAVGGRGDLQGQGQFSLRQTWEFMTRRPNMAHWLLYQLLLPAMYLHAVIVLPSRYEQRQVHGEDLAAYDIPFAMLVEILLVFASRMANTDRHPLGFFVKAYILQALLIVLMLSQYRLMSSTEPPGMTHLIFTSTILNKTPDLLFFVFEVGEFAFYDRVALLQPEMKSTLIALQTSAFNFAEFMHSWLAPKLVDAASSCKLEGDTGHLQCEFDAYPLVGSSLLLGSCLFLGLSWGKIHRYQDVMDKGWAPQEATITRSSFVVSCS